MSAKNDHQKMNALIRSSRGASQAKNMNRLIREEAGYLKPQKTPAATPPGASAAPPGNAGAGTGGRVENRSNSEIVNSFIRQKSGFA